ncbi:hypothetical protein P8605_44095 [Streptomyces sp. T-3]|nr:hypothetical protein [Streptomyces sp. T-3]
MREPPSDARRSVAAEQHHGHLPGRAVALGKASRIALDIHHRRLLVRFNQDGNQQCAV